MEENIISKISSEVENIKDIYIEFLQKLVQTPSVNPFTKDPLKSSPYSPIELEVAELIYNKLCEIGLSPKFVGMSYMRPNVIAEFGDGEKTLIFNGHMDTVIPSKNYSFNPFSGFIQDGKLFGVGSYDMKASLVAFIAMADVLLKYEDYLNGKIQLQFVVDEETMGSSPFGTNYLLDKGYTGDAAIVGEPGTYKISIGNRGGYRFFIEVYGESVHTGMREWEQKLKGKNAIIEMQKVIESLQDITLPNTNNSLFSDRTNVFTFPTLIEGGTNINMVPDVCRAYGDVRILPGVTRELLESKIKEKLNKLNIDYKLRTIVYVPAVYIDPNEKIVQLSKKYISKIYGREPKIGVAGAWSDMWMFINRGIPAINFGPDGKNAHAPDEFVYLDSFVDIIKVYSLVALDFLS